MFKLVALLALAAFGRWSFWSNKKDIAAFDASGQPTVHVYTFAACGLPCTDLLAKLKQTRVPFTEFAVDLNDANSPVTARWKKFRTNTFPLMMVGNERMSPPFFNFDLKTALAKVYGEDVFTARERRYLQRHFDAAGKPQIVMYSASWCPYCVELRKELNASNTPFVELEVAGAVDKAEISETMEISGYPTVYVGTKRMKQRDVSTLRREANVS
jgi:glutaredoxin